MTEVAGAAAERTSSRRWRKVLGLVLAPVVGIAPAVLLSVDAATADGQDLGYAISDAIQSFAPLFGLVGPLAALLVMLLMAIAKAPSRAWLIVPLFTAAAGLLMGLLLRTALGTVFLALIEALPAALAYCAVAGVRWR